MMYRLHLPDPPIAANNRRLAQLYVFLFLSALCWFLWTMPPAASVFGGSPYEGPSAYAPIYAQYGEPLAISMFLVSAGSLLVTIVMALRIFIAPQRLQRRLYRGAYWITGLLIFGALWIFNCASFFYWSSKFID
jgi:hypothetical protein